MKNNIDCYFAFNACRTVGAHNRDLDKEGGKALSLYNVIGYIIIIKKTIDVNFGVQPRQVLPIIEKRPCRARPIHQLFLPIPGIPPIFWFAPQTIFDKSTPVKKTRGFSSFLVIVLRLVFVDFCRE